VAVLDIDGTVAEVQHRLHLIDGTQDHERWVQFFAAAADDAVLAEGRQLANELAQEHDIVWLTGRPERIRLLTERWLADHGLPGGPVLMQKSDDLRPARVTKLEQLRALREQRDIAVVIDDDPRVVEVLRTAGFPVQLATWKPWTPVLDQT
jgi:hypothetical protein